VVGIDSQAACQKVRASRRLGSEKRSRQSK
jgi:hypothetical protein